MIGRVKRRLYLAVFTSAYSNYRYCKLYHRQDTLAFLETHNEFFAHLGGVYQEMVYDNMRVAIREFVGRHEKIPTDALAMSRLADNRELALIMHSFYMTQGTIKPSQKKLKGSNQDCGGFEIGLEGFYPGIEKAVQKWIQNFGIDFKGIVIIQNCASNKRYLIGEPCNLVHLETIDTTWGEEIDKDKGHKFGFLCKQSSPMAFYEGALAMDPNPVVN